MIRAGAIVCPLAILLGPLYTEAGYDWIRHSISELAAQDTDNAWAMRIGLLCLGSASILGYFHERNKFNIFFLFFGIFIALSAVLPHKPFIEGRPFSELLDQLHSACASLGGLSAVAGFIVKAVRSGGRVQRMIYASITAIYTVLPVAMFAAPEYQGVFQRMIFGSFILWLLTDNPAQVNA